MNTATLAGIALVATFIQMMLAMTALGRDLAWQDPRTPDVERL